MRRVLFAIIFALIFSANSYAQTLHLLTSLDPIEAAEYIDSFEKATGVEVQWIRLSAGEALARLSAEADNPTQDVWFGAPASEFEAAKNAGLLESYSSANTVQIPTKWRDPKSFWTGIYMGAIAFISAKNLKAPLSWQDLLKPEYKGEIVVSYPYTAGTGYTILWGLRQIMGDENAFAYYKKLDGQIRRYTKSGSAPIMEVGLGEAGVGIVFAQDALRKGVARGFEINVSYPADGVPYEIGGVAIIRGGDKNLAAKFVDWATSVGAQNLLHKWYRTPLHPKAIVNKDAPDLKMCSRSMDLAKSGELREEMIRRWREKTGK